MDKQQPITLKQLNAAIAEKFPTVYLVAGHNHRVGNYFVLTSEDEYTASRIARLPVTDIAVKAINDLTIEQWVSAVDELFDYENKG